MSPIQQMLLGVGAVAEKTYVDDIFSTYLWKGTGSGKTINNGIDLSGEGGLTWIKKRSGGSAQKHILSDTVRGFASAGNAYYLSSNSYEQQDAGALLTAFNNNGFTVSSNDIVNGSGAKYTSWSFRKTKGFFTICEWTGNDSASRQISHDLGCQPGLIILKNLDRNGTNWMVWHRDFSATQFLELNATSAVNTDSTLFGGSGSAKPTSTHFTIGSGESSNKNGDDFIAYLFAGGESTAATARSVTFDPTYPVDYLSISSTSDFAYGTGDFTWEAFVKFEATDTGYIINHGSNHYGGIYISGTTITYKNSSGSNASSVKAPRGQWNHIAVARSSGTTRVFVNGLLGKTKTSDTTNYSSSALSIGADETGGYAFTGEISNVRLIKGTALYTSSFRPPTEPLTNVTNTKLLCCNNSSTTGSTVTPGTITANGSPTASTDSPFDDPAGFKFGDAGDQNVIKCGSYVGNGNSSDPPEIYLGWEPQWVMVKHTEGQDWIMVDSMRGMFNGLSQTPHLRANSDNAEQDTSYYRIDVSSATGFAPFTTDNGLNQDGNKYVYIALRRPDGYVGKPPELGTGVFAMDGSGVGTPGPSFISNFPVDFALDRKPTSSQNWYTGARILKNKYLATNTTGDANTDAEMAWDYSNGFVDGNFFGNSANQAWMWKRHAGLDVVAYAGRRGGATVMDLNHNLGVIPEMIIIKKRNNNGMWAVYHKGVNGGTNPEQYMMQIDANAQEDQSTFMNDTAPTATVFTVGSMSAVNDSGDNYIAFLFSSIEGISKVGSYTGNGSATERTITLGFQPRFLIVKRADGSNDWIVFDTTRTWGSGNDYHLSLNTNAAQVESQDIGAPTSTGFTLNTALANYNANNSTYIYYAHA